VVTAISRWPGDGQRARQARRLLPACEPESARAPGNHR